MTVKQKRTPNQIEFDKQIARLNRIVKQIERETGKTIEGFDIPKPKRITKQKIEQLKAIKPKFLREQLTGTTQRLVHGEIKPPKVRKPTPDMPSGRQRNSSLNAMLRSTRRKKNPKNVKISGNKSHRTTTADKDKQKQQKTNTKKQTASTQEFTEVKKKPPKGVFDTFAEQGQGAFTSKGGIDAYEEEKEETTIDETEEILYQIRGLLEDWSFVIQDAHEGYEEIKEADKNLVSAVLEKAIADLGEEQVAMNIKNNADQVELLINRIIYGSDETTVRFDLAELARILRGRALTIDESIYLSELYENRTYIDYDETEYDTNNPHFATLKGYDED